jgi:hypothetical protein
MTKSYLKQVRSTSCASTWLKQRNMDTTQKKPINIKDPTLSPKVIAMLIGDVDNKIALARLKDEKNKTYLSLKPFLMMATKHFNLKNAQMEVDADGFEDLHRMNPDLFYHTEESLKEQGLREVPKESYPSPYGGSLYYDDALWRNARELRHVEGMQEN